jgi:RNA polymerase sigma-70 factor, ECF subfamily
MRRNALGRAVANTVGHAARRFGATGARWFRPRPLVPDAAFQDADEPYPGHWRRLPLPWPPGLGGRAAVQAALDALPATWREVLLRRDVAGEDDRRVAAELGLTAEQERDVLARARAALRARLDAGAPTDGPPR